MISKQTRYMCVRACVREMSSAVVCVREMSSAVVCARVCITPGVFVLTFVIPKLDEPARICWVIQLFTHICEPVERLD